MARRSSAVKLSPDRQSADSPLTICVRFGIENDKEIALASAPALQPNFMSKCITKEQIAKLQALRRQRLQLKHTNGFTKNKVTQNKKNVNDRFSCSLNLVNTSTPVMKDEGSEGLVLKHQEHINVILC